MSDFAIPEEFLDLARKILSSQQAVHWIAPDQVFIKSSHLANTSGIHLLVVWKFSGITVDEFLWRCLCMPL